MKPRHIVISIALGLALSCPVAAETIVITEPKVRTIVTEAGYGEPVLIEREGELWRIQSMDEGGDEKITIFVNPEGQILGAAEVVESRIATTTTTTIQKLPDPLTPDTVRQIVMNAGFHNVHDIDFIDHRGLWKAEADDIGGDDYELHVDADTGMIVHIEDD